MSRSATNCSPSFGHIYTYIIHIFRLPCFVFCMWQTVAIGAPTLGKWTKCFCNEGISYTIWPTKCNKSCEGQGKCSSDGCVDLKSVRHSSQRLKPKTYVWIFSLVLYLPCIALPLYCITFANPANVVPSLIPRL